MNKLMTKMSPTATKMIRIDHAAVMALFHKVEPSASDSVVQGASHAICDALEIHAQLEEELFYPALRECGIDAPQLERSVPEHDEMRRLIGQVRSLDGQREAQITALQELMSSVIHHVADEETQLLPQAEMKLGQERLCEMGARMTKRRLELAKPKAGQMAADLARAAPARTALMTVGALVAGTVLLNAVRGRRHHYS